MAKVVKLFTAVSKLRRNKLERDKPFQPSLMFVVKAKRLPKSGVPGASLGSGLG